MLLSRDVWGHRGRPQKVKAKLECQFNFELLSIKMPDIKAEIATFSRQSENVLLLLLNENDNLKNMLKDEVAKRENDCKEIKDIMNKELNNLKEKLEHEGNQREKEKTHLQNQIDALTKEMKDKTDNLQKMLENEREDRINEAQQIGDYFK